MRMDAVRWPRFSGLYGTAIGFGLGIVATIVSATTPNLAASVLVVAVVSAMTTVPGAFAAALQTWLLHAGFVIGSTGQVAFTDESVSAAVTLAVTAVAATAAGAVVRLVQRPRAVVVPVPRQAMGRMDYVKNVGVAP
jgi:small basic protein